jgi:hypothetical protein
MSLGVQAHANRGPTVAHPFFDHCTSRGRTLAAHRAASAPARGSTRGIQGRSRAHLRALLIERIGIEEWRALLADGFRLRIVGRDVDDRFKFDHPGVAALSAAEDDGPRTFADVRTLYVDWLDWLKRKPRKRPSTLDQAVKRIAYHDAFLDGVMVADGGRPVRFTDKAFRRISTDDVERAIAEKARPREEMVTASRRGRVTRRTMQLGGRVAANRLLADLRALWRWAIVKDFDDRTPFAKSGIATVRATHEEPRTRLHRASSQDPLVLQDPAVQGALVDLLAHDNQLKKANFIALQRGQPPLLEKEGIGYYYDVLGMAGSLLDIENIRPVVRSRLLAELVRSTYNPDSPFAGRLSKEGERIVPAIVELGQSEISPERWNAYSLIAMVFQGESTNVLAEPLSEDAGSG